MNTSNKARSFACILSDEELAELCRLLDGAELQAGGGLFLQGELVRVVVSAWDSEAGEGRCDAHLTAFDAANRPVRLEGVDLRATAEDEQGWVMVAGEEVARGDLALKGLWRSLTYRLRVVAGAVRLRDKDFDVRRAAAKAVRELGAAAATPEFLAALEQLLPSAEERLAAQGAGSASKPPEPLSFEAADGRLRGSVRFYADGDAAVVFETSDPSLAGAAVRFDLVEASGRIVRSGEVRLEPAGRGLWEGRWIGAVQSSAAGELLFEVLPREVTAGPSAFRPGEETD